MCEGQQDLAAIDSKFQQLLINGFVWLEPN